ncbi:putative transcriptional regulatory protein [Acrodontium crateriforme]|uniref:Transcriptional regulatory protein n=1 Tax=Acrodontium crateriforme TaxID=150365 RepID=A0AAQ3MAU5_9PEZI|nr:putative transcriptional regulatory protein [Acrodontium crateriforme]
MGLQKGMTLSNSRDSDDRPVKRQKVTRACDACKSRKRRCTGELPCSLCFNNGAECTYTAAYTRGRLVEPLPSEYATNGNAGARSGQPTNVYRDASPDGEMTTFAGQYLGPASPYAFLRRAWKRFGGGGNAERETQRGIDPGQAGSIFSFGDRQVVSQPSTQDFRLPDRATTSKLLNKYFDQTMATYRFLHRQTIAEWLETYHQVEEDVLGDVSLSPARRALVLMVLATACMFEVEGDHTALDIDDRSWQESERLHQMARRILADERGKVMLVSVQARLALCLYLMQTSRPNQAWYTFGTTVQMIFALGMHRAGTGSTLQMDPVKHECRKRAFWAASTLDAYLSVILGRPPLIHEDDVDQNFPVSMEDEDLTSEPMEPDAVLKDKDSVITASILHAKLARVIKRAAREQYAVARRTHQRIIDTATKLNAETAAWKNSLPVVLSGAVRPSSLMPVYRRQINVLQLAHAHTIMLSNRPLLLQNTTSNASGAAVQEHLDSCISAAKSTLDLVINTPLVAHRSAFPALWMTQYVTFLALSITYVWLIQRRHGRLAAIEARFTDDELMSRAESVQKYLADATRTNAPSLRYNIVLEELHQEAQRLLRKTDQGPARETAINSDNEGLQSRPQLQSTQNSSALETQAIGGTLPDETFDWTAWGSDFPIDPDLWLQLDSIPFIDCSMETPD